LDEVDADTSISDESKTTLKLHAIACDSYWWTSADSELRLSHGDEEVERFYENFSPAEALRHRSVAIFGKKAIDNSHAAHVCWLVGQSQFLEKKANKLNALRDHLAPWLLDAVENRDFQSVHQLAEILKKWPKDVPEFDRLERFPIKRAADPQKSDRFLILKAFADCLQKYRRLPTKKIITELRMVDLGSDREFRKNIKDLGFGGLPSE
jgi:hypothetical protein